MAAKKTYTKPEPTIRRPFKPAYPPSVEQEAIFEAKRSSSDNIGIDAGPGSGKSTTIKWAMTIDGGRDKDACMLALMKSIVKDIEPECAPHVKVGTAHSFGYGALAKKFGRLFVYDRKIQKIFKELYPGLDPDEMDDEERGPAYAFMFDFLKLADMVRVNLVDEKDVDSVVGIIRKYGIDECLMDLDKTMDCLKNVIAKSLSSGNTVDFVDMMWMPIRMGLDIPSFSTVYVDERQDLNPLMIEYVSRMTKERIIHVGDEKQCQPKGTKVMKSNGSVVNIEDIKIGDTVVAYHPSKGWVAPEIRVTDTAFRPYFGDLHVIKAGDKVSKSTPNHKWYVKWSEEAKDKYCVYLMLKDNQFRIGKSKLFYEINKCGSRGKSFDCGPSIRCAAEGADAYWILEIVDTNQESLILESFYSFKFRIPQLRFVDKAKSKNIDDAALEKFWEMFGDNYHDGVSLLDYLNMDIQYPFRDRNLDNKHTGFTNTFFCYACNLKECMMVPVFNTYSCNERSVKKRWTKITLSKEHYHGMVYSLNVHEFHTYVSDGILTGNSIMGFAGADTNSTKKLIEKFGGQQLPLKVCYRCGTDIVAFAQQVYPDILPFDKNPTGSVEHREELDWDMPDGSMILARRNSSLIGPCFAFLRKGRKAVIKGKDIGASLLKIVKAMKAKNTFELIDKVNLHRDNRIEKLMKQKGVSPAMIERIQDECACIIEIAMGCNSVIEIENRIDTLFDENTKGILLSSIHKSKGLEADQVSIFEFSRVRLSHDKMSSDDHIQEKNLDFVARTRAKKILHLVDKKQ